MFLAHTGLHVFANIYDVGANSVKSLKLLGATRWKQFFKLQNQGTVTVYDPPHLLKCTRNVFLKYDVQLVSECVHIQLPATAKWEDILNVYKWDKQNIICLFYKLTYAQLSSMAQYAMKVTWAAEVMIRTVGASLNAAASLGKGHYSAFIVFL